MLLYLETLDTVKDLCKICDTYRDKMDIDVTYGRYTIDGCSVLGVASLLGNVVGIKPNTDDGKKIECFYEEIKNIGAYN